MTLLVQAGKLSRDIVVDFAREFLLSDKHVPKEMVTLLVRYVAPQDESLLLKYSRTASYVASLVRINYVGISILPVGARGWLN